MFGSGGLGGDLRGAVGNMFGPVVGDSYGLGGLGIRGSGSGGGGQGETIGIGAVGTKGRGGGLGSYGTGVGGLGKKGDRDVNISTGTAVVMGSVDRELIRKVIQDHAAQIRYCYEQQLAVNPRLQGKVSIKWVINGDGSASNPQIDHSGTTLEDGKVHECMMSRITSWAVPEAEGRRDRGHHLPLDPALVRRGRAVGRIDVRKLVAARAARPGPRARAGHAAPQLQEDPRAAKFKDVERGLLRRVRGGVSRAPRHARPPTARSSSSRAKSGGRAGGRARRRDRRGGPRLAPVASRSSRRAATSARTRTTARSACSRPART